MNIKENEVMIVTAHESFLIPNSLEQLIKRDLEVYENIVEFNKENISDGEHCPNPNCLTDVPCIRCHRMHGRQMTTAELKRYMLENKLNGIHDCYPDDLKDMFYNELANFITEFWVTFDMLDKLLVDTVGG